MPTPADPHYAKKEHALHYLSDLIRDIGLLEVIGLLGTLCSRAATHWAEFPTASTSGTTSAVDVWNSAAAILVTSNKTFTAFRTHSGGSG